MQSQIRIAPSVLSADFARLGEDLAEISSADYVHFDVMDGHFAPNISFGLDILKATKRSTELPVDVHLMISNPDQMVPAFLDAGADNVTFHIEATDHANRLIQLIHAEGRMVSVAVNPATPVCLLEDVIEDVDMVLVMTVNPGFGGQKFIPASAAKLRRLRRLCAEHGASPLVEVDGGINAQTASIVAKAGANVLVAGSAVFGQADRSAAIAQIRAAAESGLAKKA
ncbi:MAG: ribulose-phosphate 3-epimerase [Coriobacteriia bacterium]|nr:MAG: ribulose-phosphate 3-epimerase [Coriobacteriia bacterium]